MPSIEIDTRTIDPAVPVTVTLFQYETAFGLTYGVQVDQAGEQRWLLSTQDRSEALDAYRHPFTRKDCPDIWAEAQQEERMSHA